MWLRSRGTGMICATVISERPYPGLHCQYHVQRRWHPAQGPIMVELNVMDYDGMQIKIKKGNCAHIQATKNLECCGLSRLVVLIGQY